MTLLENSQNNLEKDHGWHATWENNVYKKGKQLNRYPHQSVIAFLFSNFKTIEERKNKHVLELGFGAGNNLWFAAREGFHISGIEASPTAVEHARLWLKEECIAGDLREGDFCNLPWDSNCFDVVIDRGSLTCNSRTIITKSLDEAYRVLKKGGLLLSSVVYSSYHPDIVFGKPLGDNTYDNFTDGYFKGLGRTHFSTLEEIKEMYGSRFSINSIIHTMEEQHIDNRMQPRHAFWKIECKKD